VQLGNTRCLFTQFQPDRLITVNMRALHSFLAILAASVLLFSCHPTVKSERYSSNADGFSAYFPAKPVTTVKQEKTIFGTQAVHYVTWKPGTFDINKLKLLQVTFTDCPRSAAADSMRTAITLDSSMNLLKRDYSEFEIETHEVSMDGYPGRSFIYLDEKENSNTVVRQILANNKIYTLTAVTKKDYPANDELNSFFDKFQILR